MSTEQRPSGFATSLQIVVAAMVAVFGVVNTYFSNSASRSAAATSQQLDQYKESFAESQEFSKRIGESVDHIAAAKDPTKLAEAKMDVASLFILARDSRAKRVLLYVADASDSPSVLETLGKLLQVSADQKNSDPEDRDVADEFRSLMLKRVQAADVPAQKLAAITSARANAKPNQRPAKTTAAKFTDTVAIPSQFSSGSASASSLNAAASSALSNLTQPDTEYWMYLGTADPRGKALVINKSQQTTNASTIPAVGAILQTQNYVHLRDPAFTPGTPGLGKILGVAAPNISLSVEQTKLVPISKHEETVWARVKLRP